MTAVPINRGAMSEADKIAEPNPRSLPRPGKRLPLIFKFQGYHHVEFVT